MKKMFLIGCLFLFNCSSAAFYTLDKNPTLHAKGQGKVGIYVSRYFVLSNPTTTRRNFCLYCTSVLTTLKKCVVVKSRSDKKFEFISRNYRDLKCYLISSKEYHE